MYTIEQAEEALHKKFFEDMRKRHLLYCHEHARELISVYDLPYRVLFDYLKNTRDYMEVDITPYYPYPGIPIEYKPPRCHYTDIGYTDREWLDIIVRPTGEVDENGKEKRDIVLPLPPEVQAQIDEWQQARVKERTGKIYKHIWNLNTEQGRKQWLYWFMVFLIPYADSVPGWNAFDLYGDTEHTTEEVEERKRYYIGLIDKCRNNPKLYKHTVQRKDISDYDKYDMERYIHCGYMWHDDLMGTPPPTTDKELALAIMYKEREIRCKDKENYENERRDNYSKENRIETIIEQLEKEVKDNGKQNG